MLLALFAYALPLLEPPLISTPGTDFGGVLFTVTDLLLVALGLNIVVGYAGLLDLGYVGFYAIGAYTAAILTSFHANWPLLLALPVAVLATMISGVMLGAPTLRVRGDYLAIVTLGFGEIIRLTAVNIEWLGAAAGISNIAPAAEPRALRDPAPRSGTARHRCSTSTTPRVPGVRRAGPDPVLLARADRRHHHAVRRPPHQGQPGRPGLGGDPRGRGRRRADGRADVPFKLLAFAMGAFVGGLAGALYASRQSFINPQSFLLLFSILFLAAVVVGGQGNRWGVLVGRVPGRLPARAVPRLRRLPRAGLRRWR